MSELLRPGDPSENISVVEHNECTLDLREVLRSSKAFYDSHNLHSLADALPDTPDSLTDKQRERITFALEQGFTSALILPSSDLLQEKLDDIVEECANKPSDKLTGENQYTVPFVNPDVKSFHIYNRPSSSAYLLLYSSGPIPEQTKHKTAVDLIPLFQSKHLNGLTLSEHLLLQRIEAEKRGNHSFDAYRDNPEDSNGARLLDFRTDFAVSNVGWDPRNRQVMVSCDDPRNAYPKLGARSTVVVELGKKRPKM